MLSHFLKIVTGYQSWFSFSLKTQGVIMSVIIAVLGIGLLVSYVCVCVFFTVFFSLNFFFQLYVAFFFIVCISAVPTISKLIGPLSLSNFIFKLIFYRN